MLDAMTTRTDHHTEAAAELLVRAHACLADGDPIQASEKGWEAAAQMVKAVAEARGWEHSDLREMFRAIHWLVEETGQPELRTYFSAANVLQMNFYDDFLPVATISFDLEAVERLVELLGPLSADRSD